MIGELLNNKLFWVFAIGVSVAMFYKIFFSKDKSTQLLEKEYHEILNSDEYKVKGQYD